MATYKRLPRGKQKKTADELIDWTVHALRFLYQHMKLIAWGAGVTAVIIALIIVYTYYQKHQRTETAVAFYEIQKIDDAAQKREALLKFIGEYDFSKSALLATFSLANNLARDGEYDQALQEYDSLLKQRNLDLILKMAAFYGKAEVLLAKNEYEKAAQVFLAASEVEGSLSRADSIYRAGLCYEEAKDFSQAEELYTQAIDLAVNDPQTKNQAEERLLWLLAQGNIGH